MKKGYLLGLFLGCLLVSSLVSDEITDAIDKGLIFYKQGEYSNALESLSYANQLIRQKKGDSLESILPQPFSGWGADKPSSTVASDDLLGGGISVERHYYKDESNVDIIFLSDTPLMQSILMLLSNPVFATSEGSEIQTISSQQAIVNYDEKDRSGDVNIVVADKYLVQINGLGISKQILIDYTEAIDFAKLKALK